MPSRMNIAENESLVVEARTCGGGNSRTKKVAYKFNDAFHSVCLDKRDIMLSEISACEELLKYCSDVSDRIAVEKELSELKMALDLML